MTEKQTHRVKALLEFFQLPYRETAGDELETTCWKCGKERHLYATEKDGAIVFSCKVCQAGGGEAQLLDGLIGQVVAESNPDREYWSGRGIGAEIQDALSLKYSELFSRLVIPYERDGRFYNLALRSRDGKEPKYLRLPGVTSTPYVLGSDAPNIVLTEGEVDAISAYVILKDHPKDIQVVGLPGADFAKKKVLSQFIGKNIVAVVDNDKAGAKAARKILDLLPGSTVVTLPTGFKDLNELLVSGGSDARDVLVDALNETTESKKASGSITMEEFLKTPPREELWQIPELWADNAMGIIAGVPKTKKSLLTLYLAYSIAEGLPFLGRHIQRPGPVILVNEEDPERVVFERLKQLSSKGSSDVRLMIPSRTGWHLKLTDADAMARLEAEIQEYRPVMVILDPLSNVWGGLDENSASEVSRLLDQLRHWRDRYHCSIALVHHTRKITDGEPSGYHLRGSSVLFAKTESLWILEEISSVNLRLHSIQKAGEQRKLELEYRDGRFDVVYEGSRSNGEELRKEVELLEAAGQTLPAPVTAGSESEDGRREGEEGRDIGKEVREGTEGRYPGVDDRAKAVVGQIPG